MMSIPEEKNVLLLGMVYAHQATEPKRGQEFRDRVRCEALENHGYKIHSLDDKHDDSRIEEHCRANFADPRRMLQAMSSKWPETQFQHVILDYFFSPAGWARQRWGTKFFSTTLPSLAKNGMLAPGGKIWLPNLDCIEEQLTDNRAFLSPYFTIRLVRDSKENPLYLATEDVEKELLRCPDALTNETQIRPLLELSDQPFYVLEFASSDPTSASNAAKADNITPVPVRVKKTRAANPVAPTRARRTAKREYVSDASESEGPTPVMKRTRRVK